MDQVYMASPLGFSELGRKTISLIKGKIQSCGYKVHDPWDLDVSKEIAAATNVKKPYQDVLLDTLNLALWMGGKNREAIDASKHVFAILDGAELDSGTVAELAYAVGQGKRVYGYRGDFRNLGEFPSLPFNMQVWYFIVDSGGQIFRSIDDIMF
jgi:nucleoside 2-deoxyribosyltransferase